MCYRSSDLSWRTGGSWWGTWRDASRTISASSQTWEAAGTLRHAGASLTSSSTVSWELRWAVSTSLRRRNIAGRPTPLWYLVSPETRHGELALPRAEPGQQFDEPVCCGNGHNGAHAPVVFALPGQISSLSKCRITSTRWFDHSCLVFASHQKSFLVSLHSDQVQEELTRVVGSRQVRVEDRKDLPFTDAVIHESQRLCNIVPMAIPHKTSRDVTFEGHFIEKVNQNEY